MNSQIDTHYERVMAIIRPERLRSKRLLVIGAGSLGSPLIQECARLGIGVTVVDQPHEILERHNIVRHSLGLDQLGRNKAEAVVEHAARFHPEPNVRAELMDVVSEQSRFEALVGDSQPDVIAVTTDNEDSRHAINAVAYAAGVPMVMGGVFDAGMGGMVAISRPGEACYGCISAFLGTPEATKPHKVVDYNSPEDLNNLKTTSALNIDILLIAAIQAKVVLSLLEHGDLSLLGLSPADAQSINTLLFSNRRQADFHPIHFGRPFHATFLNIPSSPECFVCGTSVGAV